MKYNSNYFFAQQDFFSAAVFLQQDSFLGFSFLGADFVSCACNPIVNKAMAKTVNNFFIFV
ncbi:hypothetical protein BXU10_01935 [Flavobacterium sp. LM4]|nr:hypothetical protein BXU10_01935 [Flavobacterium sp. LM4]